MKNVGRWVLGIRCWWSVHGTAWKAVYQNFYKFTTRTPYDLAVFDI